jgi:hypothetical protein
MGQAEPLGLPWATQSNALSLELLRTRLGVWLAVIAKSAHTHLVDSLMKPSPLGAGLAKVNSDRAFSRLVHWTHSSLAEPPPDSIVRWPLLGQGSVRQIACFPVQHGCHY